MTNPKIRVMVFGTFDMVHQGHKYFFDQARKFAESQQPLASAFLIVSIARDKNVERIKGRAPRHTQTFRRAMVAKTHGVDKAVLGGTDDHIPHIIRQRPDVIALGYDQVAYVRGLRSSLSRAGLHPKIIRIKAYKPHIYKTSRLAPIKNKS